MNKFLWDDVVKNEYPRINKDMETDILIIGAGMTGISTAFYLKSSKKIIYINGLKKYLILKLPKIIIFLRKRLFLL